ncbi:hypothetical protein OIU77_013967 [Salix suchowensis]|uniref:Uncharacterized protein n=1 Tax=Salix suchowensis TaxID=1278906 RepID=A0ABQ8ZWH0_9ROSI|nr:hypothetical protein OIU77_013967 [Salix suchowensis]
MRTEVHRAGGDESVYKPPRIPRPHHSYPLSLTSQTQYPHSEKKTIQLHQIILMRGFRRIHKRSKHHNDRHWKTTSNRTMTHHSRSVKRNETRNL